MCHAIDRQNAAQKIADYEPCAVRIGQNNHAPVGTKPPNQLFFFFFFEYAEAVCCEYHRIDHTAEPFLVVFSLNNHRAIDSQHP